MIMIQVSDLVNILRRKKMRKIISKLWQLWLRVSIPVNIVSIIAMAAIMDKEHKWCFYVMMLNYLWLWILWVANRDDIC